MNNRELKRFQQFPLYFKVKQLAQYGKLDHGVIASALGASVPDFVKMLFPQTESEKRLNGFATPMHELNAVLMFLFAKAGYKCWEYRRLCHTPGVFSDNDNPAPWDAKGLAAFLGTGVEAREQAYDWVKSQSENEPKK